MKNVTLKNVINFIITVLTAIAALSAFPVAEDSGPILLLTESGLTTIFSEGGN